MAGRKGTVRVARPLLRCLPSLNTRTMRFLRFLLFFLPAFSCLSVSSVSGQDAPQVPVGQWRTHFALSPVEDLTERGELIYGLSGKQLLYFDKRDNRFGKMDRTKGLTDVNLSAMAYDPVRDVFVLGYDNGKIDLVYGEGDVSPVSDIFEKNIGAEKTIQAIRVAGRYAYIATGFGLVVLDLLKEEVKETYMMISGTGTYEPVSDVQVDDGMIYILTGNCLKYAPEDAPNLNDYAVWQTDTCIGTRPLASCGALWGKLLLASPAGLYWGDCHRGWEPLAIPFGGKELLFAKPDKDYLVVGLFDSVSNRSHVEIWSDALTRKFLWQGTRQGRISSALVDRQGELWVGGDGCLARARTDGTPGSDTYCFNGPLFDAPYAMSGNGKGILSCLGGYTSYFAPIVMPFQVSYFSGNEWENISQENFPELASWSSASYALEDPRTPGRFWVAGAVEGLAEISPDGKTRFYTPSNSPLEMDNVIHTSCRLTSLAFDREGDLWILNTLADNSLHVLHQDGSWNSYDLRVCGYGTDRVSDLMVDYWQHKWVLFNKSQVAVFETDGNSIKGLQVDMNKGNDLLTTKVFCMVEDALGHVWFGTDRGVKIIDQHAAMFDSPDGSYSSVPVKTIRVPRDGYLMELLRDDQVTAIAVDGGNRKWLGTSANGLYLVSSDGMEELAHFTVENSPLLSNSITHLSLNQETGELFIASDQGVVSYRGTATSTDAFDESQVRVYPNPVRPGYAGYINIKGLPSNAIVKITDTRGNLIYQARATGGQLSWDGFSLQGRKPDSGVLLVFASDDDRKQKLACKIFYVR